MLLGGCGFFEPPQSEAQIKAEIAKLPHDRPGLWSMHEKLESFSAGGVPAAVAERAQKELAARGRLGQVTCLTAEQANLSHYEQLRHFGGASCTVTAFHSDGAAFDGALQCNYANQLTGSVELSGTGSGEVQRMAYEVIMAPFKGEGPSMNYAGTMTMERTGECPAQ
jgi:hypothetical protein